MAEVTGASPPALASRPEVLPGLGSHLEAFDVLCRSRGVGYAGPLPIQLAEIESYCRLTDWCDPEAVAELVAIVQALDVVYLGFVAQIYGGDEADAPAAKEAGRRARVGHCTPLNTAWSGREDQK